MRIGIDARFWGPQESGLGRYVDRLLVHLHALDLPHEFVIFLRREVADSWTLHHPKWRIVPVTARWYSLQEQITLPWVFWREKLDLLHVPHYNAPILYPRKVVVTIHDLILNEFPTQQASTLAPIFFTIKHLAYRLTLWRALRHAQTIITISQYSKQLIEKLYPGARKKISITYEASDPLPPAVSWGELAKRGIGKPYLMYAGNSYPHKNLERFLDGVKLAHDQGEHFQTVLIGKRDFFSKRLEAYAKRQSVPNVLFFGYASDAELHALYLHAQAYFFPSLSEGFGLPGLEAMNVGTPLFSSRSSCLPEVFASAAHYFDSNDLPDISRSIKVALHDILERQRLLQAGKERVREFSWQRMAKETVAIYERSLTHDRTQIS